MRPTRRQLLAGFGATALGGMVLGSTAFSQVEVSRSLELEIVPDDGAQLAIEITGAGEDSLLLEDEDGVLAFGGDDLNQQGRTVVGRVDTPHLDAVETLEEEAFTVTNDSGNSQDIVFEVPNPDPEPDARMGVVVSDEDPETGAIQVVENGEGEVVLPDIADGEYVVGAFLIHSGDEETVDGTLRIGAKRDAGT